MPATLRSTLIVGVLAVLGFAAMKDFIFPELKLLIECHDNPEHLARTVGDLRKKLLDKHTECDRLREMKNDCVSEKDSEISHVKSREEASYNKGYWVGFLGATFLGVGCFAVAYMIYKLIYGIGKQEYDREMAVVDRRVNHLRSIRNY